jgi:DNA-directed RNA polymerase specialized sigma24 family protein
MDCGKCENYQQGQGNKQCLRCNKYLYFVLKSGKRNPVIFEHFTQAIWDSIPQSASGTTLIDLIRRLPIDNAVPLMMQYYLDINTEEIAKYLKTTRQTVYIKNKSSLKILKTWLK